MMKKNQNKNSLVSINSLMSREEQERRGIYSEYSQYSIEKRRVLYNKTKTNSFFITLRKRELPAIRPKNFDSQPQNVKLLC